MKCFRHPESEAVGTCKHCFKGTTSACAKDTGIGIVRSAQCEEEVRAVKFLVDKNKQAYPLVAKAHGRNTILLTLFGLAFIAVSFIARGDSFLFPFLLAFGTIMVLGASFSVSLANWYGVEVQRNVTLLHRSKTTIRQLVPTKNSICFVESAGR